MFFPSKSEYSKLEYPSPEMIVQAETLWLQVRNTIMVFRVFVERKPALAHEAAALLHELHTLLGMHEITSLRIVNQYDVDHIQPSLFDSAKRTVFSEPQTDIVSDELSAAADEQVFAVEYLPGQFDQRADSAAQCIQLISPGATGRS